MAVVRLDFDSFTPASWNPVPGNEVLDLLSVENIVFAANWASLVQVWDRRRNLTAMDRIFLHRLHRPHQPSSSVDSSPPTSLVWSDEFNGSTLIRRIGDMTLVAGAGVMVSRSTTPTGKKTLVFDGALIIEAHKEDYLGSSYTSARLDSESEGISIRPDRARVKVPAGTGTWPAFWMLGTGLGEPGRTWPNVAK